MKQRISAEVIAAATAKGLSLEDVLRDLLHLPTKKPADWTTKGVTFPEGTMFRTWYGRRPYWGEVRDGALYIEDKRYTTPSAAAVSITNRPTNGWDIWECQFPRSKQWVRIGELRKKAQH